MFNHAGSELKGLAKRYVITRTLISFFSVFIGGFAVSYFVSQSGTARPEFMWIWIFLMAVITMSAYHKAKMQAIRDYVFGQMVEDVERIREVVEQDM